MIKEEENVVQVALMLQAKEEDKTEAIQGLVQFWIKDE